MNRFCYAALFLVMLTISQDVEGRRMNAAFAGLLADAAFVIGYVTWKSKDSR